MLKGLVECIPKNSGCEEIFLDLLETLLGMIVNIYDIGVVTIKGGIFLSLIKGS